MVVRACEYDPQVVIIYALYFCLHVITPGVVVMYAVKGRPLSLTTAIALGIPTGFAIELLSFLGLAALGARQWMQFLPVGWIAVAILVRRRDGAWPVRCRLTARHALLALAMSALFLWTVLLAASQMFSESPLVAGLPQRPIFHDWVYLLSRAATIKQHWPLEDPSLAGTTLQYHYFMLVHVAAASWVTKLELGTILLRLMIVPLGGVLIVQAYALGRLVSRRAWGGVLAALLTVGASEVSFSPSYGESMFLGLFVRWLYVSPTFLFGMIFFGALLFAVASSATTGRLRPIEVGWLGLMAAAATGAKGTVMPILLLALGLWAGWNWWRERHLPWRLVVIGAAMTVAFGGVYVATMSSWGGGQARFEPFHVYELTQFWKTWFSVWQHWLARWLPDAAATQLAALACGVVAFVGTCGVRLLAIPYLLSGDASHRQGPVAWLGAVTIAGAALGGALHLHANSELYLILVIRLPLAVLASAFVVSMASRLRAWTRSFRATAGPDAAAIGRPGLRSGELRLGLVWFAVGGVGLALAAQSATSVLRQQRGFSEWLRIGANTRVTENMRQLRETMLWIRGHTERDAVLVANAFTPVHLQKGRGRLVDHTTAGVHYYYSALSERRLWVEGPTYVMQTTMARQRMERAARVFAGGAPASAVTSGPCYALVDLSLGDGAKPALPLRARVFANARYEIYRLPPDVSAPATQLAGHLP